MKKAFSILLTIALLFTSVGQGLTSFALEQEPDTSLEKFAEELVELVRKTDTVTGVNTPKNNTVNAFTRANAVFGRITNTLTPAEELPIESFATKRLIVKCNRFIDTRGAMEHISGYRNLHILQYNTIPEAMDAYNYYVSCAFVEYVEPDRKVEMQGEIIDGVSESIEGIGDDIDESIGDLKGDVIDKIYDYRDEALSYASKLIGFEDVKAKLAQKIKDDYVLVAVLDSGVDTDHELLEDRLVESNVNLSTSGKENSVEDDFGHGTHVAGIIVDNTLDNVKIKPYKVLNSRGFGNESTIAIAIDLAVADGAGIINLSLTAEGENQTLTDSVNNAVANDVNVVVASGNQGADLDNNIYTPSCIPSAITVSAVDENKRLASYSNYDGPIDITAPGTDIYSSYLNNSYLKLSGTSMAAPVVTAALSLVKSLFPEKTSLEAEEMIKELAIKIEENENENHYGAGLVYVKYLVDGQPKTSSPVFSRESGIFNNSFDVSISCADSNARIYYIVSDSEDLIDINWSTAEKYTTLLHVSLDTVIYAVAISDGMSPSDIVSVEYIREKEKEEDYYDIDSRGFITGYVGDETDLVVPSVIHGKRVKGVGIRAFIDNDKIRNIVLPSSATEIKLGAFKNCSALQSVTGAGITTIGSNAFENSSITRYNFDKLKTIGASAFSDCRNLKNVLFDSITSIGAYAFENVDGVIDIDSDTLTDIGPYAFSGSGLKTIRLTNISKVGTAAFQDCPDLVSVNLPVAEIIESSGFRNCPSLKQIEIPRVTEIKTNGLCNTGIEKFVSSSVKKIGTYAFADCSNLAVVYLNNVEYVGNNSFENCISLQTVYLGAIEQLTNDSFSNCNNLFYLYLPSVKTVNRNALKNTNVEYIQFDSVTQINSLPENTLKGLVLPSCLTGIDAPTPENNFVVYGYKNTFAQQYATDNNKFFVPLPAVIAETTLNISIDEAYFMVYAIGYNCTYQWYKNSTHSNVGGIPIEGATESYYRPCKEDNAVSYYCVVTSSDSVNTSTVSSNPIANIPQYRAADFTEYNRVTNLAKDIDREGCDSTLLSELDRLLAVDVSGFTYFNQDEINYLVEEISRVLYEIEGFILTGDVNGDGRVTAIDARYVLKFLVESINLDEKSQTAADCDGDGKITIIDARLILIAATE